MKLSVSLKRPASHTAMIIRPSIMQRIKSGLRDVKVFFAGFLMAAALTTIVVSHRPTLQSPSAIAVGPPILFDGIQWYDRVSPWRSPGAEEIMKSLFQPEQQ